MMKKICFLAILLLSFGCGQKAGNSPEKSDAADLNETLIKANKQVVQSEDQQIDDLLERYGWKMVETGTGLRYLVYKHGNGPLAQKGQQATIRYTLRLISGDIVYSSDDLGPKQFTIGSGGVESGLEEAILLMHLGDKAKVVIPSYLAFGLIGDQDRIPPKSTLIYDIELITLINN